MEDLANLKIPDLKKECKARGLSTTGNKAELVSRLHSAMAAEKPPSDDSVLDDALIDEDSMLGDDDSSGADDSANDLNDDSSNAIDLSSPTATVPPVSVGSAKNSPEKKSEALKRSAISSPTKATAQSNGAGQDDGVSPAKKKITINREPLPAPPLTTADDAKTDAEGEKKVIKPIAPLTAEEKAKLRAEKFGNIAPITASISTGKKEPEPVSTNKFLDERMKKRAERFNNGVTPSGAGVVSLTTDEDMKLAKRKERFGLNVVDNSSKKESRAARFASSGATSEKASVPTEIAATAPVTTAASGGGADASDKKQLRAARFGGAT